MGEVTGLNQSHIAITFTRDVGSACYLIMAQVQVGLAATQYLQKHIKD